MTADQINNVHNLHAEGWSLRRIARHLRMDTRTIKKYLLAPVQKPVSRPRASKLDIFKSTIDELRPSAGIIFATRLRAHGTESR